MNQDVLPPLTYFQAFSAGCNVSEAGSKVRVKKAPRNGGNSNPPLRQCRDIAELCLADDLPGLQRWTGARRLGGLSLTGARPSLANVWGSLKLAIRQPPSSWFSRGHGDLHIKNYTPGPLVYKSALSFPASPTSGPRPRWRRR